MAPKRSAPPPAVASSEETDSGSASDESEEEIACSPPTTGPKVTAPPPQKLEQPEASDEEEEEEEEESESGEEEEEEEDDVVAPPLAARNPPPKRVEPESGEEEEEEEETNDEAPEPVVAPKPPVVPASSEDKKQTVPPFQRTWSKDDDVRILEALTAHHREHGTLPQPADLEATLAGRLDHSGYSVKDLASKVKNLKGMYSRTARKVGQPSKDVDRRIFDLAKELWGGDKPAAAKGTVPMDFNQMCEMYPYLAEEVTVLEKKQPGLFKREFSKVDSEKARVLDQKIKKQRLVQVKLELRHHDIEKEVTKTLMDLMQ